MDILKDQYSITELSEILQVTDHALRYYEKEFGISVPKDGRGRRFYTPELANTMFQIKNMRDQGLEIKAIKNILQSKNIISEPPPVVLDTDSVSLMPSDSGKYIRQNSDIIEIKKFFTEFKEEITNSMSAEVLTAREQLTREMQKTKLELGACVENSTRKLEAKLEKHFQDVDRCLTNWRSKGRQNLIKKFLFKITN